MDEKLLPDTNSSSDMKFDVCDKHFTDVKSYEEHMKSKAHQQIAAGKKVVQKPSVTKESDQESNSDDDDEDDELFCDVCDKRFNNYASYMTHRNGKTHSKKMKQRKLKEKMSNMPELVDQENEDEGSGDEILQAVFARCAPCQKAFSGPESFALHMQSANHKKKIKQSKLVENMKAKHQDETKELLDEAEFYGKCKTCDKSFSGVIPYEIHMKSGTHKKELEKLKIAEEIKEFRSNDSTKEEYVCKECKKTFVNPLAFKSHLENNSHEKRKAKAALKEFLNAYPEIIFTTPLDEQTKESGTDDDDDVGYFLICKICSTSFSGPESAQDHVKSKKHISLKKKKDMLKILKNQKENENNSEITNGKNSKVPSTHTSKKSQLPDGSLKNQSQTSDKNDLEKDDFEMV